MANMGFDTPFVVMFGGANQTNLLSDTWLLTATVEFKLRWTRMSDHINTNTPPPLPTTPPARYYHSMATYTTQGTQQELRTVMFGGCGDVKCQQLLSDTWVLSGQQQTEQFQLINLQWTLLTSSSPFSSSPSPRRSHSMAFLGSGSVLMFGGACGSGIGQPSTCDDTTQTSEGLIEGLTWKLLSNSSWERVLPSSMYSETPDLGWPTPRYGSTMASMSSSDSQDFTVIMLGGSQDSTTWTFGPLKTPSGKLTSGWVEHSSAATPAKRAMSAMVEIPSSDKLLLFGGSLSNKRGNLLDDKTWYVTTFLNKALVRHLSVFDTVVD
jgi:hypothetical protein